MKLYTNNKMGYLETVPFYLCWE